MTESVFEKSDEEYVHSLIKKIDNLMLYVIVCRDWLLQLLYLANRLEPDTFNFFWRKKMSMTLLSEMNCFPYDGSLLGFCLSNPDEPFLDDFETRCRSKLVGKGRSVHPCEDYFPRNGCFEELWDTNSDEHLGTLFSQFCAMTSAGQAEMLSEVKAFICSVIGVSPTEWEPSDEFALDYIQDETPIGVLYESARAAFDAFTGHDLVVREEDDVAFVPTFCSRGVYHFTLENGESRDRRRGRHQLICKRRVASKIDAESHCVKYGRHKKETFRRKPEVYFGFAGSALESVRFWDV